MTKFNREFNIGDRVLCKDGLTTVIRGTIDYEVFEQGKRYKVTNIVYLTDQAYEYTIVGENKIGINFYQFFDAIDPDSYDVYEFFYTLAQERRQKILKAESNANQEEKKYFGWYWIDEINPDRDSKGLSQNPNW